MQFVACVLRWVAHFWTRIRQLRNYYVYHASINYVAKRDSMHLLDKNTSTFWELEEQHWDTEEEEFYNDITYYYPNRRDEIFNWENQPMHLSNLVLQVKYLYNDRVYRYVTKDLDHAWPPIRVRTKMTFVPPILSAWLLGPGKTRIVDVTKRIKEYVPNLIRFPFVI